MAGHLLVSCIYVNFGEGLDLCKLSLITTEKEAANAILSVNKVKVLQKPEAWAQSEIRHSY